MTRWLGLDGAGLFFPAHALTILSFRRALSRRNPLLVRIKADSSALKGIRNDKFFGVVAGRQRDGAIQKTKSAGCCHPALWLVPSPRYVAKFVLLHREPGLAGCVSRHHAVVRSQVADDVVVNRAEALHAGDVEVCGHRSRQECGVRATNRN